MQRSPLEAERWWKHAEQLYAAIDEPEGLARCLQHLGSAAVVAGDLEQARKLLEQSALLRQSESELLTRYLKAARETGQAPEVDPDPVPRFTGGWIRRRLTQLRDHFR
jgi:hypothetical protein